MTSSTHELQGVCVPHYIFLVWLCAVVAAWVAVFSAIGATKAIRWLRMSRILNSHFPSPPINGVMSGHASIFSTVQPHRVWADWSARLGGDFYARLGPVHVIFVSNPVTARFLHDRSLYPHTIDRGVEEQMRHFEAVTTDSNTPNLISCHSTERWRLVRRGLAPAFGPDNLKRGFHHIAGSAARMSSSLVSHAGGPAINIDAALQWAMLDVLGGIGFGGHQFDSCAAWSNISMMELLSETIELGGKEVCARMANPMRQYMFWDKGMRSAEAKMSLFKKAMRHLLAEVKEKTYSDDDPSIMAHLLRIRDSDGQPLNDNELHSQLSAIFFGGTDSTTHTMAYALAYISQDESVHQKITEELASIGLLATAECPEPRPVEHADLGKLPYLTATIKETMRIAPVIPLTARIAKRDIVLPGGRPIPAGTAFIINSSAMHNEEQWYPNADKFMPERWLDASSEYWTDSANEKLHYKRFIPFGEGLRNCVGKNLANIAMRGILAQLLGRFNFELSGKDATLADVRKNEYLGSAVYPNGGLGMKVVAR